MQIELSRYAALNLARELQKLAGPMASGNTPDHVAGEHIEGGIQAGGAVAL